jgi:pseudouridine-5'-phosphate glycosidase
MTRGEHVRIHPEVAQALADGGPVVALESTIISHGLPRPDNLRIAREIEQAVRDDGAVPATIAIIDGQARIGLDDAALDRLANDPTAVKASVRDIATVAARGSSGGMSRRGEEWRVAVCGPVAMPMERMTGRLKMAAR